MTINDVIESTARKTARSVVSEMKRKDMVKSNALNSFKKTEKVLYEYPAWKKNDSDETRKFCELIERALKEVERDPYYELIELKYFERWTHERIAEYFDVDVSVISKRRTKLIDRLRPIIFSEDFIKELFGL
nr:MAG TPA: ECF sigma factor [Caudoviricetes sp.]